MRVFQENFRSSESWSASTRGCLVTPGGRERRRGEEKEIEREGVEGEGGERDRERRREETYGTTNFWIIHTLT